MSRIYPSVSKVEVDEHPAKSVRITVLTVWKKSSMTFQGTDGFSVYDNEGRLAFRVDNYSRRNKYLSGELLLMDGSGRPLLALRPQILSMHDRWNGFSIKDDTKTQAFSMRKRAVLQHGDESEVFMGESTVPEFRVEGCFQKRCCKIWDSRRSEVVAEVSRKKAGGRIELGSDVFTLAVRPGVDCKLMMAFVVVMDRISHKSYTPLMCSY